MNSRFLKLFFLTILMIATGLHSYSQDKPAPKEKSAAKKTHSTSTIVLKITKDENGKVITIDTTFSTDNMSDSTGFAIANSFDTPGMNFEFFSNDFKNFGEDFGEMIKKLKLDTLHRLGDFFNIEEDNDSDMEEPEAPEAPIAPSHPKTYSYNYNWNHSPGKQYNDEEFFNSYKNSCDCPYCRAKSALSAAMVPQFLQEFLSEVNQEKEIKIKTRRNGHKVIIKIRRSN
jgi:hypothetical protein